MLEQKPYKVWVVHDGKIGRRNQCLGVAQKMDASIKTFKLSDIEALNDEHGEGGLSRYVEKRLGHAPKPDDWPDIILSSGDEAGEAALALQQLSGNRSLVGSVSAHKRALYFDFLTYPKQAPPRALPSAAMEITGVPHKVTPLTIERDMQKWEERMQGFIEGKKSGQPVVSVLVGGDISENKPFTLEHAREIGDAINREVRRMHASLLITNSPRISVPVWRELLKHATEGVENVYVHDCRQADGNPFMTMLGLADVIAVTGDSMSMCYEAASTMKPVYVFMPENLVPDIYEDMLGDLYKRGMAKKFEGSLEPYKVAFGPPLDEAGRIAGKIMQIIESRREKGK